MNKTAIKNFAVWARNKLIADISYRAGLIGITESGIASALPQSTGTTEFYDIGTAEPYSISGDAVRQRRRLVELIERKENEADYKTAYKYIIEEVAYTWFNRLIAIRFMEVNDYLPSHIRVLSSESGKIEPDLVTTPFDAELEFSKEEEQKILELKRDNKLDEVFQILFVKQCNALNDILPELFETTKDYTELLLNISVVDKEGVVYRLINDISEDDFNVERGGQVEIIGWLYQYYISEPKDVLINARSKYKKDDIPYVTQLFTSEWIVKFLVENSLGRMWNEGHPDTEIKKSWKFFLEESKQDEITTEKLASLRKTYNGLNPEDIKVLDPCMGSGHILVYAFDMLMQIYESKGYSQRDAAKSILDNNLYGLDIDERAFQMAYFSVLMKARQYNRRILTRKNDINLVEITESNLVNQNHIELLGRNLSVNERNKAKSEIRTVLNIFKDAKEYGSAINVPEFDWELINNYLDSNDEIVQISFETIGLDETKVQIKRIVKAAQMLAEKYDVIVTNPPYMNSSYMPEKLKTFIANEYPEFKSDLFAVFCKKVLQMGKQYAHIGLLMPYVWMFIGSYEEMRRYINQMANITSLVQLEYNAFEAACVPVAAFTMCKTDIRYNGEYIKLSEFKGIENQEPKTLQAVENVNCPYRYSANQKEYSKILGSPFAYWVSEQFIKAFENGISISQTATPKQGMSTCDVNRFVKLWHEVNIVDTNIYNRKNISQWVIYNKGGEFRKWYGNREHLVLWHGNGDLLKANKAALRNQDAYFKEFIAWTKISSTSTGFRSFENDFLFDGAGGSLFLNGSENKEYYLGFLNSKVCGSILNVISPTMNFNESHIGALPLILDNDNKDRITSLVKECISLAKEDWDSFENSWDYKKHCLVRNVPTIEGAYDLWKQECENRFNRTKELEEEINEIFINIYGMEKELSPELELSEVTIRKADLKREIKGLLSYAVGCMLGRYSLEQEGIYYAGGMWNKEKKQSFVPDLDNIIPITDEEYLEDDIVSRLCNWLKIVYGVDNLENNLDFIASNLGCKGNSSREIIRNYFLNDFYKDHIKAYQKRPIYWLFDSGKQNGFKALMYLHRYEENTVGNLRVDYLHKIQRIYESEVNRMQDMIAQSANNREIANATKRKEKLQKQIKECHEYDEKIGHLALARISLDLDEGVKNNYEKIQTAVNGKKYQVLAKL